MAKGRRRGMKTISTKMLPSSLLILLLLSSPPSSSLPSFLLHSSSLFPLLQPSVFVVEASYRVEPDDNDEKTHDSNHYLFTQSSQSSRVGRADESDDSETQPHNNINHGLSSLFDTQRPRDLVGGLRSAVSNTLRGTFYGVASILTNIPSISSNIFSSNTSLSNRAMIVSGFMTNVVAKIVIAIAMPIAGLLVGVYQITRGFLATPSAIIDGFIKCKVFDESKRIWIQYSLDEDVAEIRQLLMEKTEKYDTERYGRLKNEKKTRDREPTITSSSSPTPTPTPGKKVKSSAYYDLLGIQPNASQSDIRSAYRRRARDVHPDKQRDDPNAMKKFRELSAAYQTLSNPTLRQRYDSFGIGVDADGRGGEASSSSVMLDPLVFFAVLFGSELVEPYIGELGLATTFDSLIKLANAGAQPNYESWEELKCAMGWSETALSKRKRQTEIATFLRSRVSDYVDGYFVIEAFQESCRTEAVRIAKGGLYGATFLLAIGPSLIAEADAFLGYRSSILGLWKGPVSNLRRNLLFLHRKYAVTKALLSTIRESFIALYKSAQILPDSVNDESIPPHRRSRSEADTNRRKTAQRVVFNDKELLRDNLSNTIPAILELAWTINNIDIANTLNGACSKLFLDADLTSWEERIRRAEAVQILGMQFYQVGMDAAAGWSGNATKDGDVDDIKARANAAFLQSLQQRGKEDHDEESM